MIRDFRPLTEDAQPLAASSCEMPYTSAEQRKAEDAEVLRSFKATFPNKASALGLTSSAAEQAGAWVESFGD